MSIQWVPETLGTLERILRGSHQLSPLGADRLAHHRRGGFRLALVEASIA